MVDRSPFLLTGGVDQRIRYYDLMTPKNSSLIVPAAGDHGADVTYTYEYEFCCFQFINQITNLMSYLMTVHDRLRALTLFTR